MYPPTQFRRFTLIMLLLIGSLSLMSTPRSAMGNSMTMDIRENGDVRPLENGNQLPDNELPSPSNDGLRTGMTWTVLEQWNGYVNVGSDGQTNTYTGDTTVDQYLPILCLLVDYRSAPYGIDFNYYNGWARGTVQLTPPMRGSALTSQQQGDTICANHFGSSWRMAEFHDGWYGSDFSSSGGWAYWAEGQLPLGTRFWTSINDQPANPWDSAGVVPPVDDTAVLTERLQAVMQPMLAQLQNPQLRNLAYTGIAQRFDGDDNVLLSTLVRDAEQAQIVNPNDPAWQSLKTQIASFQNVNGTAYDPQIYIPYFQDGAVPESNLTMAVYNNDESQTELLGYQLDASGNLRLANQIIDDTYAMSHEVWLLSINERIDLPPTNVATAGTQDKMGVSSPDPQATNFTSEAGINIICNPTSNRNNKGQEYLKEFRIPRPRDFEPWGKIEPRLVVKSSSGQVIVDTGNGLGKFKGRDVKNWQTVDYFITTWDRSLWGEYLTYQWYEIDGFPFGKDDDMGSRIVTFTEATNIEYQSSVYWKVCSVGGEGGTGNTNLALSARASASSTYPYENYSPARVNDGSTNTALGGASSWVNADRYAPNGYLPQWVQLDFGVTKTFSKVVVHTTASYPIQDLDIQIFNGITWTTITSGGVARGNTQSTVTFNFTPRSARLIRILGLKGPNNQPQYVRINEFEVY